jgi:stringent starvation protein B
MPKESPRVNKMIEGDNELSKFCRRRSWDLVMFGFVQGIRRGLPGVPVETALAVFAREYGIANMNMDNQGKVYRRMQSDLRDDQRTKQPEQA